MNLITIEAIDMHSSDTISRTLSTDNLKDGLEKFERELPFSRYELVCNELMDEYDKSVIDILDELDVTF